MYMSLITDAYAAKDMETFFYYSRFYIMHLYWNMCRLPDKNGYHIFEEKDLDARLKATDFHINTAANRQAFRAFLELIQRESLYKGIFRCIHNTQQEETESLQNVADYFYGLQSAHQDFKPTKKFTRVTSRGYIDDISASLQEELPDVRAAIERISEAKEDAINYYDDRAACTFLNRMYSKVIRSEYHLVPSGEGDDKKVKQTCIDMVKLDPIVTKAALRYFRSGMSAAVSEYMKRLILQMPELINDTDSVQEDYFDKAFEGRTFEKKNFRFRF